MASIVLLAFNKDVEVFTEVWCWVDRLAAGVQISFHSAMSHGVHQPNVEASFNQKHSKTSVYCLKIKLHSYPVMNRKGNLIYLVLKFLKWEIFTKYTHAWMQIDIYRGCGRPMGLSNCSPEQHGPLVVWGHPVFVQLPWISSTKPHQRIQQNRTIWTCVQKQASRFLEGNLPAQCPFFSLRWWSKSFQGMT